MYVCIVFTNAESPPRVMLHMAPRHVLHNTKYIEWIGTVCDSTTQHIVLSDDGATEGPGMVIGGVFDDDF